MYPFTSMTIKAMMSFASRGVRVTFASDIHWEMAIKMADKHIVENGTK